MESLLGTARTSDWCDRLGAENAGGGNSQPVLPSLCAALQTCHSWRSAHDGFLRNLAPLRSLDQAGLQRLPAVFPALTHLAFLEASTDEIKLVGHAVLLLSLLSSPARPPYSPNIRDLALKAKHSCRQTYTMWWSSCLFNRLTSGRLTLRCYGNIVQTVVR